MSTTATKTGDLTPFAQVQDKRITYPQQPDNATGRVRRAVCDIPPGLVATYGDLSVMVDLAPGRLAGR